MLASFKHADRILFEPVSNILLQPRGQTGIHGRAAREHDVFVVVCARVHVRILDHLEHHVGHATLLAVDQRRVEQGLKEKRERDEQQTRGTKRHNSATNMK